MSPFRTCFRYGFPRCLHNGVNLACTNNSPDHSSTGTRSGISVVLADFGHSSSAACKRTVSGSFHSSSEVLFTFPSRYLCTIGRQRVFSLGEWSPQFLTGFHVPGDTQELTRSRNIFAYGTLTLCGRPFQTVRLTFRFFTPPALRRW